MSSYSTLSHSTTESEYVTRRGLKRPLSMSRSDTRLLCNITKETPTGRRKGPTRKRARCRTSLPTDVTRSSKTSLPASTNENRLHQKYADGALQGSKEKPTTSGTTPTGKKAKCKRFLSANELDLPGVCVLIRVEGESQTAAKKCGKSTTVSQMKQKKIVRSKEGAVSSSSAMHVSPDPSLKESPQSSVNKVAKLSNAAEPRQISIDKIIERLIPSKLKESISRLCDKKNVRSYSLMQNPKNPRQIAIMGAEESQLALVDLEKLQTGEFSDYKLTAPAGRKRVYTKQLVWKNALKLSRFDYQVTKTCELVVRAWSPTEETELFFMVGAAHLMFTVEENLRLMNSAELNTLQNEMRAIPQRKVVHFRHGASSERTQETQAVEADQTLFSTNHPPLVSYRYYYQHQKSNSDQFQRLLDRVRKNETSSFQPDDEAVEIRESQCRNDLILFPISPEKAVHLQQQLQNYQPHRCECLVELENINQLLSYTTPSTFEGEVRIAVKNFVGQLCDGFLTGPDQQEFGNGYHLTFILNEGELVDGDSGSIVYEIKANGEHHLLGMLVGRVDTQDIFPDDPGVYYEAIILNLALKDIENHYDVTNLRPFTIG